jgi:hypothetical protein
LQDNTKKKASPRVVHKITFERFELHQSYYNTGRWILFPNPVNDVITIGVTKSIVLFYYKTMIAVADCRTMEVQMYIYIKNLLNFIKLFE